MSQHQTRGTEILIDNKPFREFIENLRLNRIYHFLATTTELSTGPLNPSVSPESQYPKMVIARPAQKFELQQAGVAKNQLP